MSNPFVNNSFTESSTQVEVHQQAKDAAPVPVEKQSSSPNGSPTISKTNSWVKFDENSNNANPESGETNGALPLEPLKRQSSSISANEASSAPSSGVAVDSPAPNFATIELSNSIEITLPSSAIVQQPVSSTRPLASTSKANNSNSVVSSAVASTANAPTSSTIASIPPSSSSTLSNGTTPFANGDILVNLLPLNEGCDWVVPAHFKPHLVPEELMAQSLTLTVEDYVTTMSMLFNDYRFNFYIVFYKRVLALWITLAVLVLLCILFSGWEGIQLFVAGMLWLLSNALGIFVAIYVKHRLYRQLEDSIAQVNAVFSKHNIFLGVDDRGRYSCHKVNLVFVYFDAKYCLKFLQDMLANGEQQVRTNRLNNNQLENSVVLMMNNTLQSIDTSDIIITGATPKNIPQKEKYAEKLLLRYSQRWIREFNRERIELNPPVAAPTKAPTSNSEHNTTNGMMNNQQPHPPNSTEPKSTPGHLFPMSPRHCRTSRCFCQYIEEHLKYKPYSITFRSIRDLCS